MDAWIRSRADWSHRARLRALSFEGPLFSSKNDAGSLTVPGEYDDLADQWCVLSGRLYVISSCSPKNGSTTIKLLLPENAFSRALSYSGSGTEQYGTFLASVLASEYIAQTDPLYAMPYLSVSNLDTTEFDMPVISGETYTVQEIVALAAEAGVYCTWTPSQAGISVAIAPRQPSELNLFDGDGHTQVVSQTYTRSIVAKATVRAVTTDKDTGAITVHATAVYYWHADGTFSTTPPSPRIPGEWTIVDVTPDIDLHAVVEAGVFNAAVAAALPDGAAAAFENNSAAYKLEFYSDRTLALGDVVTCRFGDVLARGTISYARISSKDNRVFYRAGRADTTLTEKVSGSSGRSSGGSRGSGSNPYPVGSIYLSTKSIDPAKLFGGKWERIKDTFLLCAGGTYKPGTAGGKATVTLTTTQIPSHRHNMPRQASGGSNTGYSYARAGSSSDKYTLGSPYTDYTGGGAAHENMPPYLAVYAWRRVA